jgi:pimeloyl-ACP methyl ester carboxylesterase
VPSLPGYGFSQRPARTPVTTRDTAGLWHRLMRGLGYDRYGAHGTDFGAGVITFMALDDPDPLVGIHLSNLENAPYAGPDLVEVPTGVAVFANHHVADAAASRVGRASLQGATVDPDAAGGHFAATETPERLAGDIAAFFADL